MTVASIGVGSPVRRVVVVGATRNFFKVGHTTLRVLARTRPDIKLRLGIPDVANARLACRDIAMEFSSWDPDIPETLRPALAGCDAMLMVPPIDRRVQLARTYLDAAIAANVRYILCLGIQHTGAGLAMAEDADAVTAMLRGYAIPHDVLHLPMFLENLLYQIPSITGRDRFTFPVSANAPFAYVTCADLGVVFAEHLAKPTPGALGDTRWTAPQPLTCAAWAEHLSAALGRRIVFVQQSERDFVTQLVGKGMSVRAATSVLQLWQRIDTGADIPASHTLHTILGREPLDAKGWTDEHRCCFTSTTTPGGCRHPRPPHEHMY